LLPTADKLEAHSGNACELTQDRIPKLLVATWTRFSDFPTLEQEVANDKAYKFSGLELQDFACG